MASTHAKKLRLQLAQLNLASGPNDMAAPNWRLHPLKGDPCGPLMQAQYDMWQAQRRFRAKVQPITTPRVA
jgi:proteic killer suppression protein